MLAWYVTTSTLGSAAGSEASGEGCELSAGAGGVG